MKKRINIMLSEEALAIADASGNRSEYIEELILGVRRMDEAISEDSVLLQHFKSMEQRIVSLLQGLNATPPAPVRSIDEVMAELKPAAAFVPRPPDPEKGYQCCSGQSPCKHWVWDDMKTAYVNTLTGKVREVQL